jgi:hypothetical protein
MALTRHSEFMFLKPGRYNIKWRWLQRALLVAGNLARDENMLKNTDTLAEVIKKGSGGWLPAQRDSLLDRFLYLVAAGRLLVPEYRFKWPQLTWWSNKRFTAYLRQFDEHEGMNADRKWNLWQFLRAALSVPGDTAECGAYKGASSYLICAMTRNQKRFSRTHYVFDSFEGVSEPGPFDDATHWRKGFLAATEEEFSVNMFKFKADFVAMKGWIPDRFFEVASRRFAFVHIDVDLYEPTRDSLEFFYPRLNPGGVLLCDDYGSSVCPGAVKAVDDFFVDKPEKMLAFASGGGVIIKGLAVSPELEL